MADGTSADFARYCSWLPFPGYSLLQQTSAAQCAATTAANQLHSQLTRQVHWPLLHCHYGPYSPTTCDGSQYQVRNQRDFQC